MVFVVSVTVMGLSPIKWGLHWGSGTHRRAASGRHGMCRPVPQGQIGRRVKGFGLDATAEVERHLRHRSTEPLQG